MLHQVVNLTKGKTRGDGKIFPVFSDISHPTTSLLVFFKNFAGMGSSSRQVILVSQMGAIHSVWAFHIDTI